METFLPSVAQQIADAAGAFQLKQTGHAPQSVTVVLGEDTLVITLHGALSAAEKVMAQTAAGAALVQEYHRQLFAASSDALRQEIKRITGVEVQEAAAEIEAGTGTVIHAFTTCNMVQVFHMARRVPENTPASHVGPAPATDNIFDAGKSAGSKKPA